ncbi:MAG: FIST C-terminal domain-containing protein [Caenispirillum bisanense]|nr:FIST C-terminal domain-containing protein [Caenispirillum bisanense]MCA1973567.1 FIST C-terminal domain-containing protein [Caenispirillum sp.]
MLDTPRIRRGYSRSDQTDQAVRELAEDLAQPDAVLALVFASSHHDRGLLAAALAEHLPGVPVVGCTTAGELTPLGYRRGALTGVSLAAPEFQAVALRIDTLEDFSVADSMKLVQDGLTQLGRKMPGMRTDQVFAMLLIDGLSASEERVVSGLYQALGEIPLFGGSAGDDLAFQDTGVLHDGAFHRNAAVLLLVATHHPFEVFKTEHFVAAEEKMVVTEADPSRRIVTEINAEPAAHEYARVHGVEVEELTPMMFAARPVVVKVGGVPYVRSIQKVNPDGSLTFYCAIDEGIVLTAATGVDILENLRDAFRRVRQVIGPPQLVIGCDCILRSLELEQNGLLDDVSCLLAEQRVIGFNTYGEQFGAMHVNQTFTGVAIGYGR